jgi:squalene-hopene/tetraprenyl-beta-curcumene cyclase
MALHQFAGKATSPAATRQAYACRSLIERGCVWLLAQQNEDGGWGDTTKSFSNISTTMLCHATLVATRSLGADASYTTLADNQIVTRDEAIRKAVAYIERAGGVPALIRRYGKDKTFSVPILTHCALAGLAPWNQVPRLPFELACIPASWYAAARLPVVSYALPALIAIGQVRHHHGPTWNPITRSLRWLARDRSLQVLEKIQPPNGGFLEAAPLTSFVCMSLASMGLTDHLVVTRGIDFLIKSVRPDGSWPIDTNLATWVTTLAVNALRDDLPEEARPSIQQWLLAQQYRVTHPYTNAAPGGWAWTDLPGGVPDADDTPGAVLAIERLEARGERLEPTSSSPLPPGEGPGVRVPQRGDTVEATERAIRWLVAVVIRLVRAFDGHADVVGLLLGELGELHADLGEVQAGDFFVELLRQDGDADRRLSLVSQSSI